ncbi:MAG: transposase [Lachnospiraceae bacterium]
MHIIEESYLQTFSHSLTFGIIKNDRWYKRIVRRGIKSVLLEVFLVSIGHNLYKYHNKQKKVATAA